LPLVVLHENGLSAEEFRHANIMESAARSYRVIAFDRPGFGNSSRGGKLWWTAAAQADLIEAALSRIGVERYVVLGHLALQLAQRHGSRIAGLVLVSGYCYPRLRLYLIVAALPAASLIGAILRMSVLPPFARMTWPLGMKKIFGPSDTPACFWGIMKELATRPSHLNSISIESALLLAEALSGAGAMNDCASDRHHCGNTRWAHRGGRPSAATSATNRGSIVEVVDGGHMLHHASPEAAMGMINCIVAAAPNSTPIQPQ
jgi:pimeloyl-ACP methyl ester carboxylesterase